MAGISGILREAHEFQAPPAESAAHHTGRQAQCLDAVGRHDDIGPGQQAATTAKSLGSAVQPKIPVAQERAHETGRQPHDQQRADDENHACNLRDQPE